MTRTFLLALLTCAFALVHLPSLTADVVLHYSFDSDYQDSSDNANHGVLFDSSDDGSVVITAGAAVFGDGGMAQGHKDDRVDLTTPFTPVDGTPWTIAFWADLNGGAASYGFNSSRDHSVQARADSESSVNIWVADNKYTFDSASVVSQNSKDNHFVIVAHPIGIDLDGVAGDDKFAVYANGQLLIPDPGQDLTDASVSTAIEVTQLGDSAEWPHGSAGDYDEFWILDDALSSRAVSALYQANLPTEIWYVNVNSPAAEVDQDGESWATAFTDLQDALAASGEGDSIWVANGTYYPVVAVDLANPTVAEQGISFELKAGQTLYGGFAGHETSLDIPFNPGNTILSGDLGQDDNQATRVGKNSYHIVSVNGADDCIIDGFRIQNGGDASVSDVADRVGGGVYVKDVNGVTISDCDFYYHWARSGAGVHLDSSAATIMDCRFVSNHGTNRSAAIYADNQISEGNPLLRVLRSQFEENHSDFYGGAIAGTYTNYLIEQCEFSDNSAKFGGGLWMYRSSGEFINTVFQGNTASSQGGAIHYPNGGSFKLKHVTFYGNQASVEGHAVYTTNSTVHRMMNSVLWHGETLPVSGTLFYNALATVDYTHSLVQGVDLTGEGIGNLNGLMASNYPEFTDPTSGELDVRAYSPLVNAGTTLDGIEVDLVGAARLSGSAVDIGCYEHEDPFEVPSILEYDSGQYGESYTVFDFITALDSEDDALSISSTNTAVASLAHPPPGGEVDNSLGDVTIHGVGDTNLVLDFQYQGGAIHQFVVPVSVDPIPLDERDLSSIVDVKYTSDQLGVSQAYSDLSLVFSDSPIEFVSTSTDAGIFTTTVLDDVVQIVPVDFGEADLEIRVRYRDGTELVLSRTITVGLLAASQASVDTVEPAWVAYDGLVVNFELADLSTALSEGVVAVLAASSDESVATVSVTNGVVSVQALDLGSTTISIELEFSNGASYVFEEQVSVLNADGQLHASYDFDGDLVDSVAGRDAIASVEGVTLGTNDVTIGELGVVSAPAVVTDSLLRIDDSLQLNMRFKIESADENGRKVLAAIKHNDSYVIPEKSGLMFSYNTPAQGVDIATIHFSYSDGLTDHYEFETVAECSIDQWYDLKLVFDFDKDVWTVLIGQEYSTGPINNHDDYLYDFDVMQEALRSNQLTVGSFATLGVQDALEESDVVVDSLAIYSPAQSVSTVVSNAFDAFRMHITGEATLGFLDEIYTFQDIERNLVVADYHEIQPAFVAFMNTFEGLNDPFYLSESQVDAIYWDLPDRALHLAQQWVHAEVFEPATLDFVDGLSFEAHEVFPGVVGNSQPRVASATVTVDGDYNIDPAALYIWADTVLRPLGHYAAAGEQVQIEVDPGLVDQGLKIIVGAHVRDLDPDVKPTVNRFRDISKAFEIDAPRITVANPFGGGLYVCIPDGTLLGDIDVTIEGAVKSPYFSGRAGKETDVATWLAEVAASDAPWADFESDKFMTTVPVSFLAGVTQPDQVMDRWDEIMDQYRFINGRPLEGRIRAEYYLLDRMLVTPQWGAGYPMVVPIDSAESANSGWNPMQVLTVAPHRTLLHELGHNCAIPGPVMNPESRVLADLSVKELGQWAEGESLVHIPGFSVYNRVYGDSLDLAFSKATTQWMTIEQAAYDWMITDNFRNNRQIGLDTSGVFDLDSNVAMDEIRYQARGLGRYGDIVQLFGWEGLNRFHSEFYPIRLEDQASPDGKPHRIQRDAFILRASEALQVNMAPLLHFWGVKPSAELKAALDTYPKSGAIKQRLEYYHGLAPATRDAFDAIIAEVFPAAGGYHTPRYDYYQSYMTDTDVQSIGGQIEFILAEYGLDAAEVIFDLKLRQRPDGRVAMQWTNDDQAVDHFVIRMKSAGAVVSIELGTSDSTDFVTGVLDDGAYTFSVAGVYADGTETLPNELSVSSLPTNESVDILLNDAVFVDGSGFVGSGLSTEYLVGGTGGTGGTGGSDLKEGSSLKVSAAAILDYIHYEAGDQSIGYEEVQLDSILLVLPSAFESGPSVVKVWVDDTPTYDAYAGGINTIGPVSSFNYGEQELDITALYSLEEDEDFYFFLFNSVQNNESTQQNAYLRIEFTVTGGYRHWYEQAGLELGVDAAHGDDPDADGMTNFVEFALGRDPAQAGEGATTQIGEGYDADELNIRFIRGQESIRYQIEMTEDLSDWLTPTVVWDSEVDFMTVVDPGEEQVVPVSLDGATSRFYRLTVQENYEENVLH